MDPRTGSSRDEPGFGVDRGTVEAQMGEWATYGAQLRAWVGLQVDEHLSRLVPSLMDARLTPVSETLLDLRRQVKQLDAEVREERTRARTQMETELQRLELKAGTARSGALGDLADRTRTSLAALAAEEADARHQLESRLEHVETVTKVLDETLHAVDNSHRSSTTDAFMQLSTKVEVLDETFKNLDTSQLRRLDKTVEELVASRAREVQRLSFLEGSSESLSTRLEVLDDTFRASQELADETSRHVEAIDETLRANDVYAGGGQTRLNSLAGQVEALREQLARSARPPSMLQAAPPADSRLESLETSTKVMDETYQAMALELAHLREDLHTMKRLQDTQTSALEARLKLVEPRTGRQESITAGGLDLSSISTRIDEMLSTQLNRRLEEHSHSIHLELESMRKQLLVLVRTELAKAFRSEAAAISSMDEQLKRRIQASASG